MEVEGGVVNSKLSEIFSGILTTKFSEAGRDEVCQLIICGAECMMML